jgi:hypothetical protein
MSVIRWVGIKTSEGRITGATYEIGSPPMTSVTIPGAPLDSYKSNFGEIPVEMTGEYEELPKVAALLQGCTEIDIPADELKDSGYGGYSLKLLFANSDKLQGFRQRVADDLRGSAEDEDEDE